MRRFCNQRSDPRLTQLVNKPKVQSLCTFVLSISSVVYPFLPIQLRPHFFPPLILLHIIILDKPKLKNIIARKRQQDLVAPSIKGSIIFAVDIGPDDITRLDKHVVQRRGDGSCSHSVGVARVPRDENGVAVRVGKKTGQEGIAHPA